MCSGYINGKVTLVTGVTVSVCRWGWCCTAVPGRCPLGNTSEGCPISAPGRDSRGGRREEWRRGKGRRGEGGGRKEKGEGGGRKEEGGRGGCEEGEREGGVMVQASRYPVLSLD